MNSKCTGAILNILTNGRVNAMLFLLLSDNRLSRYIILTGENTKNSVGFSSN